MFWFRLTLAIAATAAAGARVTRGSTEAGNFSPDLAVEDVTSLTRQLNNLQLPDDQRFEAARRLAESSTPLAHQSLLQTLVNLDVGGELAVARALDETTQPDPAMIDPLLAVELSGGKRELLEAVSRALGRFTSDASVLTRLIDIVRARPRKNETARVEIVKVVGRFVDKRAAELLITTLNATDESATMHAAAEQALGELVAGPQRDWSQWWAAQQTKSPQQFHADLVETRSPAIDQLRQRDNQLATELRTTLQREYSAAPATSKSELLLGFLRNPLPEVRDTGAQIANQEAVATQQLAAQVQQQLRAMIGDSSPQVRSSVASALAKINDPASLQPLLAQLKIESDPTVRAAFAKALGNIADLKAVDALVAMLRDPSHRAAQSAAQALAGQLGSQMQNTPLAESTADALNRAFTNPSLTSTPENEELRKALLYAMDPLKQPSLLPTLSGLLNSQQDESPAIRSLALRAIGDIADPNSPGVILTQLNDRDPSVRVEAMMALGKNPKAYESAETIFKQYRSDPAIANIGWSTLQAILDSKKVPVELLQTFADNLSDQPDNKLAVLQSLAAELLDQKKESERADVQENIGQVYFAKKDYETAASYFQFALQYRRAHANSGGVIQGLVTERMDALLLAKEYTDAIRFAGEMVHSDNSYQQNMGSALIKEADRLQTSADFEDTLKLIAESRKMLPKLDTTFSGELDRIEAEVNKQMTAKGKGPGAGTPLSPNQVLEGARLALAIWQ